MKLKKLKSNRAMLLLVVTLAMFVFWLLPFLYHRYNINLGFANVYEILSLLIVGIVGLIAFGFFEDLFYGYTILIFLPFMFGHQLTVNAVPWALITCICLLIAGIITRLFRFKIKWRIGPFFSGILFIIIALLLGGLLNNKMNYFKQFITMLPIGIAIITTFVYFDSANNISFKELAKILTFLGLFITLQCAIYFLSSPDIVTAMLSKKLSVGWGIHNNVAMILLLIIPAPFYLFLNSKSYKSFLYLVLTYIMAISLVLTYSRGGIICLVIELILLFIFGIYKYRKNKSYYLKQISVIICSTLFLTMIFLMRIDLTKQLFAQFSTHLESLNGRIQIYSEFFEHAKENMVFGHGMLYPLNFHINVEANMYQWGHGTLVHTLFTMGILGIFAMLFHLGQKYFHLIRAKNSACIILIIAFACSGLYGLFDLSYYFINYMILMLVMMVVAPLKKETIYA